MKREVAVSIYAAVGVVTVLGIGFSLSPIVPRDDWMTSGSDEQELDDREQAIQVAEKDYCRSSLEDVNCACFARKAGYILAQPQPKVYGYTYADRSDLARGLGEERC